MNAQPLLSPPIALIISLSKTLVRYRVSIERRWWWWWCLCKSRKNQRLEKRLKPLISILALHARINIYGRLCLFCCARYKTRIIDIFILERCFFFPCFEPLSPKKWKKKKRIRLYILCTEMREQNVENFQLWCQKLGAANRAEGD